MADDAFLEFADVVDDLVLSYRDRDDVPSKHRCVRSLGYDLELGYEPQNVCTHAQFATRPLLERLRELIEPGSSMLGSPDGDRKPSRRTGSPAPWAAAPAELVDEILLGALEMNTRIRAKVGMDKLRVKRKLWRRRIAPSWHPPLVPVYEPHQFLVEQWAKDVPRHEAGETALRDLPKVLARLQHHFPDDPDAAGALVKPSEPSRGRHWGYVEATVRDWHRRARLMTGHSVDDRTVVHRLPNPHAGKRWPGPIHDVPNDCGHDSCWRIHLTHQGAHIALRCPYCRTLGLVEDDVTGALFCDRPSCRDDDGSRHSWSVDAVFQMLSLDGGELG